LLWCRLFSRLTTAVGDLPLGKRLQDTRLLVPGLSPGVRMRNVFTGETLSASEQEGQASLAPGRCLRSLPSLSLSRVGSPSRLRLSAQPAALSRNGFRTDSQGARLATSAPPCRTRRIRKKSSTLHPRRKPCVYLCLSCWSCRCSPGRGATEAFRRQHRAGNARLELLFTREPDQGRPDEGPASLPTAASISRTSGRFRQGHDPALRPEDEKTTVFVKDSRKSNGLKFDAEGNLVACEGSDEGGRALVRLQRQDRPEDRPGDRYMDKHFNAPNDLVIDRKGRIYFTDPRYLGSEPRELESGPCTGTMAPESARHARCREPNGIALSPMSRPSMSPITTTAPINRQAAGRKRVR